MCFDLLVKSFRDGLCCSIYVLTTVVLFCLSSNKMASCGLWEVSQNKYFWPTSPVESFFLSLFFLSLWESFSVDNFCYYHYTFVIVNDCHQLPISTALSQQMSYLKYIIVLTSSQCVVTAESVGFTVHWEEMYLYGCQVLLLLRRRLMDKPQPVGMARVARIQNIQHISFASTDLERKQ